MDHQLEDGAPQRGVVEGGRAAASLEDGTHLKGQKIHKSNQGKPWNRNSTNIYTETFQETYPNVS